MILWDSSKELRMGRSTVQTPRVNPNPPNVGATESCKTRRFTFVALSIEMFKGEDSRARHIASRCSFQNVSPNPEACCTQISRRIQIDDSLCHPTCFEDLLSITPSHTKKRNTQATATRPKPIILRDWSTNAKSSAWWACFNQNPVV